MTIDNGVKFVPDKSGSAGKRIRVVSPEDDVFRGVSLADALERHRHKSGLADQ